MSSGPRPVLPRDVFVLVRILLSGAVALSSLVGYIVCAGAFELRAVFAVAGVFFLACAGSGLNQVQESAFDAQMDRTRTRPLPMHHLTPGAAAGIALVCGLTGAVLLFLGTTHLAGLLGCAALAWYNGVYTPLKPRTRFAVLAGSLTGALPPLIGFAAAGGTVSTKILLVALFMVAWQVAHFHLLLLRYGKEYAAAGFPSMLPLTEGRNQVLVVCLWVAAAAAGSVVLALFGVVTGPILVTALVCTALVFTGFFCLQIVRPRSSFNFAALSGSMYVYQTVVFGLVVASALLKVV